MKLSYGVVHGLLNQQFGLASLQLCDCGSPAKDWAYQHTGEVEYRNAEGYVYTTDLSHYKPMCRSCHTRFDAQPRSRSKEPDLVLRSDPTRKREEGQRKMAALAARRLVDPDLDQRMRESSRAAGKAIQEVHTARLKADPGYAQRMREHSLRNLGTAGRTLAERRASDPVFDDQMKTMHTSLGREVGLLQARMKRRCGGCDLVSNPGGVALHQKHTGHRGWSGA